MLETSIVRGAPESVADPVNDFFDKHGLGRPVDSRNHNGHVTALLAGGEVVGAGYAATASSIADGLIFSGRGLEAVAVASSVHALEALAVHPDYQRRGNASHLLTSIAQHARRDFRARFLVTRIEETDYRLQRWYEAREFQVCQPGQSLSVDGVPMPTADGYRDAWRDLSGPTAPFTRVFHM